MRKILSFLALLVVGFAIPQWAGAWNFNGNTDPPKIWLWCNNNTSGEKEMTYNSSSSTWEYTFTSEATTLEFEVKAGHKDGNGTTNYRGDYASSGSWVNTGLPQNYSSWYKLTGLVVGGQYRLEIKGEDSNSNAIKFRYVTISLPETAPSTVRIYSWSTTASSPNPAMVNATPTVSDGVYTFTNVPLTANYAFVFGTGTGWTSWDSLNGNRYSPSSKNEVEVPVSDNSCYKGKDGAWKVKTTGNYDITFNWNDQKVTVTEHQEAETAPATLYIWSKGDSSNEWKNFVSSANYTNGKYTFTDVPVTANMEIVVSSASTSNGWSSFENKMYTADANPSNNSQYPTVAANGSTGFAKGTGTWKLSDAGTYDIEIDWNNGTITFTKQPEQVTYQTLYLYQDTSGWADAALASAESTDGKYTFTVKLTKDKPFTFTTKSDGISGYDFDGKTRYYQSTNTSTDYSVSNGSETNFKSTTTNNTTYKSWKPSADGTYTIEVNTVNETFKVTNFVAPTPVTVDWNFSSNTKPTTLKAGFNKGYSNTTTSNTINFTFDSANSQWVSADFVATDTELQFYLPATYTENSETKTVNVCHSNGKDSVNDSWVTDDKIEDGKSAYYQKGVTSGNTYRIYVKGNGANKLQWYVKDVTTVTPVTGTTVYLYKQGNGNQWNNLGALDSNNSYTKTGLTSGTYVFSTTNKTTTATWGDLSSTLYAAGNNEWKYITSGTAYNFTKSTGNFNITGNDEYKVVINWDNNTVTFTKEEAVIPPVSENEITIYYDNSDTKWSSVKAYIYTQKGVELTTWGNAESMDAESAKIYSYTFDNSNGYKYVIFYDGGNDQNKTGDNVDVVDNHVYKGNSHKVYNPEDYVAKLYLYTQEESWKKLRGTAVATSNDTYTFTVTLPANTSFAFSENANGTGFDNGSAQYRPGVGNGNSIYVGGNSDKPVSDFKTGSTGAWMSRDAGTYKIRVNKNDGKLKVLSFTTTTTTTTTTTVRMPLTASDFADGKKHYFLVGERMGEWKLQPEWEFTDNGKGVLTLNNRFIYETDFAIAVVDNYEDYTNHCYRWYASNTKLEGTTYSANDFSSNGVIERYAGQTQYNGSNKFQARWDSYDDHNSGTNDDSYWQGNGVFMSSITVTLNSDRKKPSKIEFTKGSDAEKNKYRMFTLVGEGFYNNRYNNEVYDGEASEVRTYRSNLTGKTVGDKNSEKAWQDSWIQYNPDNRRPYVDANKEYLYHTSYTPDYLIKNPVYFNRTIGGEVGDLPFTSTSIQFVDYESLNPDDDPYWDFYKSIKDNYTINNDGNTLSGGFDNSTEANTNTKYDYNVKTLYNGNSYSQTPTGNWHSLVVKDMWIQGEFKFWSGWGGNVRDTKGDGNGATWHGPNGGPIGTTVVKGSDVKEGGDATLYKSQRNIDDVNYTTSHAAGYSDNNKVYEMEYFDRVVLWYNEEGGVGQSFIQFVRQNAGPAIYAQNAEFEGKDNYIKYSWYIQKPEDASEAESQGDRRVVGYKIHRYQRIDSVKIDLGYAEGTSSNYVNISDQGLKVKDFYRDATTRPDYTKNKLDKGQGGRGFNPGLYYYTVDVYYEENGSVHKYATSNEVPIYADELVTPEAMAYQIIELNDVNHAIGALGTSGQKYMTYSPTPGTPIYAFDIVSEEVTVIENKTEKTVNVEIPANVKPLTRATAISYLRDNQDKTTWTSDFYVRCLDEDDYMDALNAYKDNGILLDEVLPVPTIKISQLALDAVEGATPIEKGYAGPFHLNNNNYYSAIMRRGGNLTDVALMVDLSYTYTRFKLDSDGNPSSESVDVNSDASSEIYPVMPKPYGQKYRYTVDRPDRQAKFTGYDLGRIAVPLYDVDQDGDPTDMPWDKDPKYNSGADKKDVFVTLDKHFNPRSLNLEVDFNRPNVAADIYKYYDIQYTVNLDNNDENIALNATATMHDTKFEDDAYQKPYRVVFKGVHPYNSVTPTIDFAATKYVARENAEGRPEGYYEDKDGTFGYGINIDAKQNIAIQPASVEKIHLGKINRGGRWDWMYKGHKEFNDEAELIKPADADYEDQEITEIVPFYYLFQLKNEHNEATYEYLVPHFENHLDKENNPNAGLHDRKDFAYVLNDSDPLIGAYIAKGFETEDAPDVYVTAIYVFERPFEGESTDIEGYNGLKMVEFKINGNPHTIKLANGPARIKDNFTDEGFREGVTADLPSTSGLIGEDLDAPEGMSVLNMNDNHDVTGYNNYIAVRGATVKYAAGDLTVTGVDDIFADYGNDGEAVFYNLQGIQIDTPTTPGVYIRVQGKNATKVVIK